MDRRVSGDVVKTRDEVLDHEYAVIESLRTPAPRRPRLVDVGCGSLGLLGRRNGRLADLQADAVGIDIDRAKGTWYREIGQGMGAALNMASADNAYVLSDRGTWLSFKNRGDLAVLVEGDRRLFNQYGVMLVNPQKHPNVKVSDGQAFVDWLISFDGQKTIADYKVGGEQLFFPDAK